MSKIILKVDYLNLSTDRNHIQNSFVYADNIEKKMEVSEFDKITHLNNSYNYIVKDDVMLNENGKCKSEDELNRIDEHKPDVIYRFIFSIKKEDAEKYDLNSTMAFTKLVNDNIENISKNLNIPLNKLSYNYSCHMDKEEHPHIHMHLWSNDVTRTKAYLKKNNIESIRNTAIKKQFSDELSSILTQKEEIKKEIFRDIKSKIFEKTEYQKKFSSNKYGYLTTDEKEIINNILLNNINYCLLNKYATKEVEYLNYFKTGNKEEDVFIKTLFPSKFEKKEFHNFILRNITSNSISYNFNVDRIKLNNTNNTNNTSKTNINNVDNKYNSKNFAKNFLEIITNTNLESKNDTFYNHETELKKKNIRSKNKKRRRNRFSIRR